LQLEPCEQRLLFAINPHLLGVFTSEGQILASTLTSAPRELVLKFDTDIDPSTLFKNNFTSVQVTRAGADKTLGTPDDVFIVPSYYALGDHANEVIVRFAQTSVKQPFGLPNGDLLADNPLLDPTMPEDKYRLTVYGAGANPLKGVGGLVFNNGVNVSQDFSLSLPAQIVSVVPQPITRNSDGTLSQAVNQIDVYFNANDPLNKSLAETKTFYQLIRMTDPSGVAVSQSIVNPTSVSYDAAAGKATLTFATGVLRSLVNDRSGIYRLRIGTSEPLPLATDDRGTITTAGNTLSTAQNFGTIFTALQGTQSMLLGDRVNTLTPGVLYPGGDDEPGVRNIVVEGHYVGGSLGTEVKYNFKNEIGTVLGAPAFNNITPEQKQRAREVLSYYSYYLGVTFVETADEGFTIATGDPRVVDPSIPPNAVGGIAGGGLAVMNSAVDWGASEPAGGYFTTAMHEIGHVLGLGHTYELPPLAVQGGSETLGDSPNAEPIFPGDSDILLGQKIYPPQGNDVNFYKFSLPRAGTLNLETFSERLRQLDPNLAPSQLDSIISVYDQNGNLIARNDDYYGDDSFLQLQLGSGTYYVAVTSTGNTQFDPVIGGSGFGGTTQGDYKLKLTFTPTVTSGIRDEAGGTLIDGDADGTAGGVNNFFFRVAAEFQTGPKTIFVDKAAANGVGTLGSISNPYVNIVDALLHAAPNDIVRIVGNAGEDKNARTMADNEAYQIGFDNIGNPLPDGASLDVPKDVTVMIDAGAIIKLRAANIDVGSSVQGINRSGGALQVLGVPTGVLNDSTDLNFKDDVGAVYFTSYYKAGLGTGPSNLGNLLEKGNWGGLVFRNDATLRQAGDADLERAGIFLNYVNQANLSYGGGKVRVDSVEQVFAPIHMVTSRPTISFNTIVNSADAAVSADPNSFEESSFRGIQFDYDYTRSGPKVNGNTLNGNSINGLFVRIRTDASGASLDLLTTSARFSTTDMVYVIKENLLIAGNPGGLVKDAGGLVQARPNARLAIDPGAIVKLGGARIETQIGAQFLAEGTAARPIIFTSEFDDRYGLGGTFDTTNDNGGGNPTAASEGNWGGLFFGPLSSASIDHALITFAGGATTIEGGFATFNPVEIHQAQVRLANSTLERNAAPGGGNRNGRSTANAAVIFVRGAQPVIINNIIQNNETAPSTDPNKPYKDVPAISINVNALNFYQVTDPGRSTGLANIQVPTFTNSGPLVRGNRLANNPINGMLVRGGTITTNVIMDDTDIVHVLLDEIVAGNQFSVLGTLRLQSTATESLVVKMLGTSAGITASGTALEIDDRIGGTVQVVGSPNHPVVMTSLFDRTVGAGFTPTGEPQNDTRNVGGSIDVDPLPSNSGPVFLDGGDRDDHGSRSNNQNQDGWKFIEQAINFANTNSKNTGGAGVLVIGIEPTDDKTQAQRAIEAAAGQLGLEVTFVWGNNILSANLSQYKLIYVPSDFNNTEGGITDEDLARLTARKTDVQNYINVTGGGLVALTEAYAENPYSWLALPDPFSIAITGGIDLVQTPALAAAGFNITDQELTNGTPWHNNFVGPPGFNRLQPWVVDPDTGWIVTLGTAAGAGGIGTRAGTATAGDWRSIKLDTLSNDSNVDYVNELEQIWSATGDTNNLPTTAQFLGVLAKDLKSGDDSARLGFEIHGSISQAATTTSPNGGDSDVYSFRGTAGTPVWFDIDKTSPGLDTIIELIDANGAVVARVNNSRDAFVAPNATGIAKPLEIGGPYSTPDYYTTNPLDAGMRVDLPGTAGTVQTYFVRVRAASSTLDTLTAGISKGAYQLQVRLTQIDAFPGSTVRNADVRFATTGIDVIGKPERSPLAGDTAETSTVHNTIDTAQYLGNFLKTDSGALSVAGSLTAPGQVDWYKFDLNYDLIQAIGGVSDGANPLATMFQITYADGLTRPDTTLSVFDSDGHLVYIGHDSDIPDSQPRSALGSDSTNLNHGNYGPRDASIGSVELDAGSPQRTDPFTGEPTSTNRRYVYYVAVSAMNTLPTILDATFKLSATNPLVRLAPISTVKNIAQDTIGDEDTPNSSKAFPGTTPAQLNSNALPFMLGDVVAYVNTGADLYTINPFTGQLQTSITNQLPSNGFSDLPDAGVNGAQNRFYRDIAMRSDGRLMTFARGSGDNNRANTNGTYLEIDTADGSVKTNAEGGLGQQNGTVISTNVLDPQNPVDLANGTYLFQQTQNDPGIMIEGMTMGNDFYISSNNTGFRTLYVVGNRAAGFGIRDNQTQNILFRLDPDTGFAYDFDVQTSEFRTPDFSVYQPFTNNTTREDVLIGAGTGTNVVPVGVLNTGSYILGRPATDPVAPFDKFGNFADINDGMLFTIGNKTFEFDLGPVLSLDNSNVLGSTGIAALRDGMIFAITSPPINNPLTKFFELKSGPVLVANASGNGLLGQTFTLSDGAIARTFEFGSAAQVTPGNVPVAIGATPSIQAQNIVTAINVTSLQTTPAFQVRAALPAVNSTRITLTGDEQNDAAVDVSGAPDLIKDGDWNTTSPGNIAVRFEETSPIATVGDNIANAVNAVPEFAGVVTAAFSRDRISFLGATGASFAALTAASPEITEAGFAGASVSNQRIAIHAYSSATQVATAIRNAINSAGIPLELNPGQLTQPFNVFAELDGTNVKISGAVPFIGVNTALQTDQAGTITGIAAVPHPSANGAFEDDMFAVSSTGAIYQVTNIQSSFFLAQNEAQLRLLNVVTDEFGQRVQFTGLSVGPSNVEGGRYLRTLFATDIDGNIWAFDDQGQPAPVFVDGQTRVATGLNFGLQGITFSTLDSNLWHATNSRLPRGNANDAGHTAGSTFYFGLSETDGGVHPAEYWQPSALNYAVQDVSNNLSGNEALFNSYNLPGGALGSLATQEFDFSSYSAADKPTLYFNYALDTENDNDGTDPELNGDLMSDSFRVYASSDGANWSLLATNNSLLTTNNAPLAPNRELPKLPSVSGGAYQNDRSNQRVQELFDPVGNPGVPLAFATGAATTAVNWRQARVDLGDFAGKKNVQIRFDFSTAGGLGIGAQLQGGVYLAGVAAVDLVDRQVFTVDNRRETGRATDGSRIFTTTNYDFRFLSGYVLQTPTGGGLSLVEGESFSITGAVGTRQFKLTKTGSTPGFIPVLYNDGQTAEQVAAAVQAAIDGATGATGVSTVRVGSRVQLVGATSVTQNPSIGPRLALQGSALPATLARTDIPYRLDMTAEQIATEIARALDRQFAAINGASYLQAPTDGSGLLDGETFTITGPTGSRTYEFDAGTVLSLDNSSTTTVTGIADLRDGMTFTIAAPPQANPTVGTFELKSGPVLQATQFGSALSGQTFSIRDANNLNVVFEFGTAGQVQPGRVPVATASTVEDVAANIVTAINVTAKSMFPAYSVTAARTSTQLSRITLTGDLQNDAAVTGSAGIVKQGSWTPASASNIVIRFEETEAVGTVADRIVTAVNTAPGFIGQVVASQGSGKISFTGALAADFSLLIAGSSEISVSGSPGVAIGNIAIPYSTAMTGAQIATAVANAINSNPVAGVDTQVIDSSVLVINSSSIRKNRFAGMTLREFTPVVDDLDVFTTSKQFGRTLRVFNHAVTSPGTLPYSNSLEGDQNGYFYSPIVNNTIQAVNLGVLRNRNNAHEGVHIDDVIIGFAGRGEQVIGAEDPLLEGPPGNGPHAIDPDNPDPLGLAPNAVTTFTTYAFETVGLPTKVLTGAYQLTIRRGDDNQTSPVDINHRFAEGITLTAPPASQLASGQTFSITVEVGTFTFEFTTAGRPVAAGNFAVVLPTNGDATAVAKAIRDAINAVPANRAFTVKADLNVTNPTSKTTTSAINLFGAMNVSGGPLQVQIFGAKSVIPVLGDPIPLRVQGQTLISGNKISDTLRAGVAVTPNLGPADINGIPSIGVPGRTGSVANLTVLNGARLVPGVTVSNNLIVGSGAGILFSGSPTTDIANWVPFGRLVNNTIASATAGIRVVNNASPTILNNAFYGNGIAISVDSSSTTTVVGANIYQSNNSNLQGVSQTNAIELAEGAPLFVDPEKRNFYLKVNSPAIDSSVDVVPERGNLQAVTSPMGVAPSAILAPNVDVFGQLRVDDPTVQSPPGVGGNVFKDRGAIERADQTGPTAVLYNPIDNDSSNIDRRKDVNIVNVVGVRMQTFDIQLRDGGPGIDDTTIDQSKFTIVKTGGGQTKTLVPGTDFTVTYDATNKIIRLVPTAGVWDYASYAINLANGASASPIRDLVGNPLRANEASPSLATKFVIQLSETPISPWQNQNNQYDVNANGAVNGVDALLIINRLLLGQGGPIPQATPAPPYIDVNGDGILSPQDAAQVIAFINANPPGAPLAESLVTTTDTDAAPAAVISTDTVELAAAAPEMATPMASAATVEAPTATAASLDPVAAGLAMAGWSAFESDATAGALNLPVDSATGEIALAGATTAMAASVPSAAALADDGLEMGDDDWEELLDELANDSQDRVLV